MENKTKGYHISPDFVEITTATPVFEDYAKQMMENHVEKIDRNFWMVVKQKPWWMPSFLYRAVIKNLIEFQEHRQF